MADRNRARSRTSHLTAVTWPRMLVEWIVGEPGLARKDRLILGTIVVPQVHAGPSTRPHHLPQRHELRRALELDRLHGPVFEDLPRRGAGGCPHRHAANRPQV